MSSQKDLIINKIEDKFSEIIDKKINYDNSQIIKKSDIVETELNFSLEKLDKLLSKFDSVEKNISKNFIKSFIQTYPYPNSII